MQKVEKSKIFSLWHIAKLLRICFIFASVMNLGFAFAKLES